MNETMNSSVCVDASLIIRTLVPGRFSDEADTLLATWLRDGTRLRAPSLIAFMDSYRYAENPSMRACGPRSSPLYHRRAPRRIGESFWL